MRTVELIHTQSEGFTNAAYKHSSVAEAPVLWSPDVPSRLFREDSDARKDLRQEENGTTEDEMVG